MKDFARNTGYWMKTVGCCIVAAAVMIASGAHATMSTKKDTPATKAPAPSGKCEGDSKNKKKGGPSVEEQESTLAPSAKKKPK